MGNLCLNKTAIIEIQYSPRTEAQDRLQAEAISFFKARINKYDYTCHGSHSKYVEWCHAQYQLDCTHGARPSRY